MIDKDSDEISLAWAREVEEGIPSLAACMDTLMELNRTVLRGVREGLDQKKKPFDRKELAGAGRDLRRRGLPLPDILNALALSRRHMGACDQEEDPVLSPGDLSTLELNNRIIFLYDKVNYLVTEGYMG
jgi:hypothetical protein